MDLDGFIANAGKVPRLLIASGAGLSAPSGIATFRDAAEEGLWEQYSIDDVCNISTFIQNYHMVHAFYNERRKALADVVPNVGHLMIAELQQRYGHDRVMHITTNVDDLAERAGGTAMHIHGFLTEMVEPWSSLGYQIKDIGYNDHIPNPDVLSKPNVVFFGESVRYEDGVKKPLYDEMQAVTSSLTPQDIAIVIGSSDSVVSWSGLVGGRYYSRPCYSINVNPYPHHTDYAFTENMYKSIDEVTKELDDRVVQMLEYGGIDLD